MANEIDRILSKVNQQSIAKVKEIRELEAKLRPSGLSDAERKAINEQIRELKQEKQALDKEGNKLFKLAKDAKEYVSLNKDISAFEKALAKAQARGEDTAYYADKIAEASTRLSEISPAVEKSFPTLVKKKADVSSATPAPTSGEIKGFKPTAEYAPTTAGTQTVTGKVPTKTVADTKSSSKDKKPVGTVKEEKPADVFAKGIEDFGAIDTVFKTVPELTDLLTKAVNEGWTPARWTSELQNTSWFKSNATNLQQRGFYKRQYNDLVNAIPAGDPDRQAKIDELRGTTTYGRGLDSTKRLIQNYAIQQGAVIDAAALDLMAQDIYDHALDNDALAIKSYVTSNIKYRPNAILSGKAGTDLADLKKTAIANGLDLDKAFGSSVQGWLQKLQAGESVETYKNIIRQAAKIGLPEKVASLLDNGVDLETVYAPYKNIMETTLELPKGSVQLTDPVLRSAISADKEMPIYEFERALRKDNRWQYTDQARQEVSQGIQKVLQDFGFQG